MAEPLTDRADEVTTTLGELETKQVGDGLAPAGPVGREAGVALEVLYRFGGLIAEDAVDPAGIKSEGGQAPLQVCDIITTDHRRLAVEQPVTEAVARFDQRGPGGPLTDSGGLEPTPALKGGNGFGCRRRVDAGRVVGGEVKLREAGLQIEDR